MASLMDALKSTMQSGSQQATPVLGETEDIKSLLRAKSGKAVSDSSGPRQSSLAEAVQAGQTRAQSGAMAQQGALGLEQQAGQSADIAQRETQQAAEFNQKRNINKQQLDLRTNQMLDDFAREGRKLDNMQDIEKMEQIGFQLRLNNQQYVDTLKLEGQKARLDNEQGFKTQLMQDVFGDMEELLSSDLAFKTIMDADDREFEKQLAAMDANAAFDIAKGQIRAAKTQSMFEGIGGLAKAGISAYGMTNNSPSTGTTSSSTSIGTVYTDTGTGQQMNNQGQDIDSIIGGGVA